MVDELRGLEQRQATLTAESTAAATAAPVPDLHPNLPEIYRRKIEALEAALQDQATAATATVALRGLINAILVYPSDRRGEIAISLRGDLAAFLHLDAQARSGTVRWTKPGEVLGTLVAGAGFEPAAFRL